MESDLLQSNFTPNERQGWLACLRNHAPSNPKVCNRVEQWLRQQEINSLLSSNCICRNGTEVSPEIINDPVRYLDVSVDEFVGQLKSFGLPPWLVEAFAVAASDPDIPGDQSSAQVERILQRKPGSLEQFIKDYRAAFQT